MSGWLDTPAIIWNYHNWRKETSLFWYPFGIKWAPCGGDEMRHPVIRVLLDKCITNNRRKVERGVYMTSSQVYNRNAQPKPIDCPRIQKCKEVLNTYIVCRELHQWIVGVTGRRNMQRLLSFIKIEKEGRRWSPVTPQWDIPYFSRSKGTAVWNFFHGN